jgi:hypothetical protein
VFAEHVIREAGEVGRGEALQPWAIGVFGPEEKPDVADQLVLGT